MTKGKAYYQNLINKAVLCLKITRQETPGIPEDLLINNSSDLMNFNISQLEERFKLNQKALKRVWKGVDPQKLGEEVFPEYVCKTCNDTGVTGTIMTLRCPNC